jgi:predicted amino acid racemase
VVETGDGRDGIVPEHAGAEAVRLAALPGVSVEGIATNVACAGNTTSLSEPLKRFREVGEAIARCLVPGQHGAGDDSHPNQMIFSAGGSGLLGLLLDESNTAGNSDTLSRLSELRCGEALLLGKIPRGTGGGLPLPEAHGDAFILDAPVLEVAVKQGRRQILVGLGIQDVGAGSLTPLSPALEVADATSDYLALVLTPSESSTDPLPEVGDRLAFIPSYHALLAAMTSPFVEKIFAGDRAHVNGLYPPEDSGSEDSATES